MSFNEVCERISEVCAGFVVGGMFGYALWELPDVFLFFADLLQNI